jgi:hypothetical protein
MPRLHPCSAGTTLTSANLKPFEELARTSRRGVTRRLDRWTPGQMCDFGYAGQGPLQ